MTPPKGIPHLVRLADRLDIYRSPDRQDALILVLHGEHLSRAIAAGSSEIAFVAGSPHVYVVLADEIRRFLHDGVPVLHQSHIEGRFRAVPRLRAFAWVGPERADLALDLREKCLVLRAAEPVYVFEAGDYPFETNSQNLEALAELLQKGVERD